MAFSKLDPSAENQVRASRWYCINQSKLYVLYLGIMDSDSDFHLIVYTILLARKNYSKIFTQMIREITLVNSLITLQYSMMNIVMPCSSLLQRTHCWQWKSWCPNPLHPTPHTSCLRQQTTASRPTSPHPSSTKMTGSCPTLLSELPVLLVCKWILSVWESESFRLHSARACVSLGERLCPLLTSTYFNFKYRN